MSNSIYIVINVLEVAFQSHKGVGIEDFYLRLHLYYPGDISMPTTKGLHPNPFPPTFLSSTHNYFLFGQMYVTFKLTFRIHLFNNPYTLEKRSRKLLFKGLVKGECTSSLPLLTL